MPLLRRFQNLRADILILALAISVGSAIRLLPVLNASFPLNDGGLFYTMTQELIANDFRLPQFSAYNHLNIPYAYPPLGFYLTGLLSVFTGWELLDIFRLLPAIFTVFTLPAFYLFARDMMKDNLQAAIATFFFACLPYTTNWLIMGGGITRAPAFLFFLLALTCIHRLYTRPEKKYILLTILLSSLIILFHPETALYTLAAALVFFLFHGRNKPGLIRSGIVIAATLAITAPWWGTVLGTHGFSVLSIAGSTGDYNLESIREFVVFDLTGEGSLPLIRVLGVIGLILFLVRKDFLLPVLFVSQYFSDPRSGTRVLAPLLAILAAYSTTQLLQFFQINRRNRSGNEKRFRVQLVVPIVLITWLGAIMIASAFADSIQVPHLSEAEVKDLEWISQNTPENSRFLLLTGKHPMADPLSEWFPALTGRVSVATVQGYEWIAEPGLAYRIAMHQDVQTCLDRSFECVEQWQLIHTETSDYLLVSSKAFGTDLLDSEPAMLRLLEKMELSVLSDSNEMTIIQNKP